MVQFTATSVVVDDSDDGFIVVGFAGGAEALHFQRSREFDEQDMKLGMDEVYIERNDQSQGVYGGVERIELRTDRMILSVNQRAAEVLGASNFQIHLSLSVEGVGRLRNGLRAVFHGFDLLVEQ